MLEVVSIPTLESSVLTRRKEHVTVGNEPNSHDAVIMGKDGLVTVTKIQPPNPNVLVHRTTNQEGAVLYQQEKSGRIQWTT